MNGAKLRLIAAAALFLGWLAWLGYTAIAKNRGPVVSAVQVAAAAHAVIADVRSGNDGKPAPDVNVTEPLLPNSPEAGKAIFIQNMAEVKGYEGPGEYLLLLAENPRPLDMPLNGANLPMRAIVGPQRSPGYETSPAANPVIYRNSPAIRAQFQTRSR